MSFPRYPEYKDSGVEWLGEVPAHWNISRLGFESWVRARLGWKGLKADEYVDDGFAFLSTPNIKGLCIDFESVNFITQERFDESPEIKIREGDVLLAKDGSTLGTVNVVRNLPRPTTVNSSIAVITPNARLSGVFLYYLFASCYMEQTIQRTKGGMGVPHLFQSDLNKFFMPLPSLAEQTTIATFLDRETAKIDELVAEQRRLMELLKEKRQAVISHAVTKGLNPDAPMKPSGIEWLGEVPAHWEVKRLKYLGVAIIGLTYSPADVVDEINGTLVLRSSNVQGGKLAFDDNVYVSTPIPETLLTRAGDILICSRNGSRALIGKNAVIDEGSANITFGAFMTIFRSRHSAYISCVLNSPLFEFQAGSFLTSTINQLTVGVLNNFEIPFPPAHEREEISKFLSTETNRLDTLTAEAQRAIDLSARV